MLWGVGEAGEIKKRKKSDSTGFLSALWAAVNYSDPPHPHDTMDAFKIMSPSKFFHPMLIVRYKVKEKEK